MEESEVNGEHGAEHQQDDFRHKDARGIDEARVEAQQQRNSWTP
jgi:hypothetical protein